MAEDQERVRVIGCRLCRDTDELIFLSIPFIMPRTTESIQWCPSRPGKGWIFNMNSVMNGPRWSEQSASSPTRGSFKEWLQCRSHLANSMASPSQPRLSVSTTSAAKEAYIQNYNQITAVESRLLISATEPLIMVIIPRSFCRTPCILPCCRFWFRIELLEFPLDIPRYIEYRTLCQSIPFCWWPAWGN